MFTRKLMLLIIATLAIGIYSFQPLSGCEAAPKGKHQKFWNSYYFYYSYAGKNQRVSSNSVEENRWVPRNSVERNNVARPVSSNVLADQILNTGHGYIGAPYVFGTSNGRTFDCSGFVRYIFAKHGIKLPGGSYNQVNVGTTVSRSQLRKGDLVFFRTGNHTRISHVGVYAGNNRILHTYKPGIGVTYDSLDVRWLSQGYVTAKRVI